MASHVGPRYASWSCSLLPHVDAQSRAQHCCGVCILIHVVEIDGRHRKVGKAQVIHPQLLIDLVHLTEEDPRGELRDLWR